MDELAALVVAVVLLNQLVLPHATALIPASRTGAVPQTRLGAALAAAAVLVPAAALAAAADAWLLRPFGFGDLALPVVVLMVAAATALGTAVRRVASPPLAMLNATLLAVAVLATRPADTAEQLAAWAAVAGAAFVLFTALFADLLERLEAADAPTPLRGMALALVTAGIFVLGIGGLSGMLRS